MKKLMNYMKVTKIFKFCCLTKIQRIFCTNFMKFNDNNKKLSIDLVGVNLFDKNVNYFTCNIYQINLFLMNSSPVRDEDVQMSFYKYQISHPALRCSTNNQISNLCTNSICKTNAFYCDQPSCKSCMKSHQTCQHVKLEAITKLIRERAQQEKQFVMKLYTIQDQMIRRIQLARASGISNFCLRSLEGNNRHIYEEIYVNKRNIFIEGKTAKQFLTKLKTVSNATSERSLHLVKEFQQQSEKVIKWFEGFKEKIIQDFLGKPKEEGELNLSMLSDSKIIKNDLESIRFVVEQLSNPSKIQLLFRASENGFLSSKFHKVCDNIPNTLTLVKTQFGKTIAGFTPLTWNSAPHLSFSIDSSKSSFLLLLDRKQKMSLKQHEKAIYCHNENGPCFGGGCDIYIANKCDTNKESYADFPTSYNSKNNYKICQESYTNFCGAPEGCSFKVMEYEVYKVEWNSSKIKIKNEQNCSIY